MTAEQPTAREGATNELDGQPPRQPANQLDDPRAGQRRDPPGGQLTDSPTHEPTGHPSRQATDQPTDQATDQTGGRAGGPAARRSTGDPAVDAVLERVAAAAGLPLDCRVEVVREAHDELAARLTDAGA
ncbi:MAG TPA: hypothetical protein VFJ97_12585 [Dermatophilaceae bacterium]|nr:hypothetical protein [Dermatophilaceae bacterium]